MSCCPNKPKMPRLTTQLKDLSKTLAATLSAAARGNQVVADDATIERRSDVCKGCVQYTGSRCRACGCVIAMKVILEEAECPELRW
jgi:hypothetical protein